MIFRQQFLNISTFFVLLRWFFLLVPSIFVLLYNLCKFKFRTWRHLRLVLWLFGILFYELVAAHFMPLAFCLFTMFYLQRLQPQSAGKRRHFSAQSRIKCRHTYVSCFRRIHFGVCEKYLKNAPQLAIMLPISTGNHKKVQTLSFNESFQRGFNADQKHCKWPGKKSKKNCRIRLALNFTQTKTM